MAAQAIPNNVARVSAEKSIEKVVGDALEAWPTCGSRHSLQIRPDTVKEHLKRSEAPSARSHASRRHSDAARLDDLTHRGDRRTR
jgi:hypothetical protein